MSQTSRVLAMLYGGTTTKLEFHYDQLTAPPLMYFLSPYDISQLTDIALDPELSAKPELKFTFMDNITRSRGFRRLAGGTNRVVYRHQEVSNIVIKCALDRVGMSDNPHEAYNQRFIKPYCTKVFEVTPNGAIGLFERVDRITSRYEFATIAEDVFAMITNVLVGKYILDDFGTDYMYNWGIRRGFGPVILDFPYVYPLDGGKLFCRNVMEDGSICNGEIDYDAGFNHINCTKCGKLYWAKELAKDVENYGVIHTRRKGDSAMKIKVMQGNKVVAESNSRDITEVMRIQRKPNKSRHKNLTSSPKVVVGYGKTRKDVILNPNSVTSEYHYIDKDSIKKNSGLIVTPTGGITKKDTTIDEKIQIKEEVKEEKPAEVVEVKEQVQVQDTVEVQEVKEAVTEEEQKEKVAEQQPEEQHVEVESEQEKPIEVTSEVEVLTPDQVDIVTKEEMEEKQNKQDNKDAKKKPKRDKHGRFVKASADDEVTIFKDSMGTFNTGINDALKNLGPFEFAEAEEEKINEVSIEIANITDAKQVSMPQDIIGTEDSKKEEDSTSYGIGYTNKKDLELKLSRARNRRRG